MFFLEGKRAFGWCSIPHLLMVQMVLRPIISFNGIWA
jgi:hypothetical protein